MRKKWLKNNEIHVLNEQTRKKMNQRKWTCHVQRPLHLLPTLQTEEVCCSLPWREGAQQLPQTQVAQWSEITTWPWVKTCQNQPHWHVSLHFFGGMRATTLSPSTWWFKCFGTVWVLAWVLRFWQSALDHSQWFQDVLQYQIYPKKKYQNTSSPETKHKRPSKQAICTVLQIVLTGRMTKEPPSFQQATSFLAMTCGYGPTRNHVIKYGFTGPNDLHNVKTPYPKTSFISQSINTFSAWLPKKNIQNHKTQITPYLENSHSNTCSKKCTYGTSLTTQVLVVQFRLPITSNQRLDQIFHPLRCFHAARVPVFARQEVQQFAFPGPVFFSHREKSREKTGKPLIGRCIAAVDYPSEHHHWQGWMECRCLGLPFALVMTASKFDFLLFFSSHSSKHAWFQIQSLSPPSFARFCIPLHFQKINVEMGYIIRLIRTRNPIENGYTTITAAASTTWFSGLSANWHKHC